MLFLQLDLYIFYYTNMASCYIKAGSNSVHFVVPMTYLKTFTQAIFLYIAANGAQLKSVASYLDGICWATWATWESIQEI